MKSNEPSTDSPRVLFAVMPWADVHCGSLGVSTLKAVLAQAGVASDVRHFNLQFARQLGPETYSLISQLGGGGYRGEIFFTPHYFDIPLAEFVRHEIPGYAQGLFSFLQETSTNERYGDQQEFQSRCVDIAEKAVPSFLSNCLDQVNWENYDIVGFSLMFDQTLPSLYLARAIKQRYPHITIVFGGSACDGEMGAEMARSFDCIDVVVRGEADHIITRLVQTIREHGDLSTCPGIVFRRGDQLVETDPSGPVTDMDSLPNPDYEDYVSQAGEIESLKPVLYFESSRGCWWGQKHLCSFCGLNASGLTFRRKSAERVLDELLAQERRYGISTFIAADNIIDMTYFKSFLPLIADINSQRPAEGKLSIFYETKSNLKKWQMTLLKEAGVGSLQPGIESFSDHVLELMKKGCSGIQQVQFIKWGTELGLNLIYGVLYGNPGETRGDYEEMLKTIRMVRHLHPPVYVIPMALDRFSPYFNDPQAYGIKNVRAHDSYARVFRDEHIDHERLAYKFSFDHDDKSDVGLQEAINACLDELKKWRQDFQPDRLVYTKEPDTIRILDRRTPDPIVVTLRGAQAAICDYCDEYRSFSGICAMLPNFDREKIKRFLQLLIDREWMYRDQNDCYIFLPVYR
ncbi:MAG TPA: RiPP maturation radical SAM C-methyltransferase, partial [Pyrinomonadaceae bacterium]|nr:RiPP maturation radical SAM C-methyltransferase [Pyrinomonadaceae bacterium]